MHEIKCKQYYVQATMHVIQWIGYNAQNTMKRLKCIELNAWTKINTQKAMYRMNQLEYDACNILQIIRCVVTIHRIQCMNTMHRIQCIEYNEQNAMHRTQ